MQEKSNYLIKKYLFQFLRTLIYHILIIFLNTSGKSESNGRSTEKSPRQKDGRDSATSTEESNISQQQPRKMTFMEQVNKRKGKG